MLKQAARDREAASEQRQALLVAIQSGAASAGRYHLALQVCQLTVARRQPGRAVRGLMADL